jgi:eukaryotic-like serine/threonine-protein kinase
MDTAVDTFLKTVLKSGVLDNRQLEDGFSAVPKEQRSNATAVAEHLIKTGKLSRFQATKLLRGTGKGLVLGPFQILAPVGAGGMARVYLARDSRDQKLLALKVLPPKKDPRHQRLLARFRREMDMCRRVDHPHVARTFEVGVKLGIYYIAMEFIPGQDLSKLVHKGGALQVPRAARLFAEVASALQHAHEKGLIHRDLKPSNIRVTTTDRAKVLDLGLALLEGDETTDRELGGGYGYIVGSMDYIAPEQTVDACAVDGRADIYALGCSLYFTLTGQPPFAGGSKLERILRHRKEEPVPLVQRNSKVPPRFAELVHRMMAKNPDQRFESMQEVRRELLAWSPASTETQTDRQDEASFRQAVATLQDANAEDDLEAIPVWDTPGYAQAPLLYWVAGGVVAFVMVLIVVLLTAIFWVS